MNVNEALHGLTTIIEVSAAGIQSQGTGFFYHQWAEAKPEDRQPGGEWREITNLWLVTNRHVIFPRHEDEEKIPDYLSFRLRKVKESVITWVTITVEKEQLLDKVTVLEDDKIDVAIITILDLIRNQLKHDEAESYLHHLNTVGKKDLPDISGIPVEAGDDILVVGFPRGFYDSTNLYPIVKSGIIASKWGASFDGNPFFLIDAKLFPGSSGSIVVSKPINLAIIGNALKYAKEKKFMLLGIFSGEPFLQEKPIEFDDITIIRKQGFNVGIVWYSHLIETIIETGKKYNAVNSNS